MIKLNNNDKEYIGCYFDFVSPAKYIFTLTPKTESVDLQRYNETTQKYDDILPNVQSITFSNLITL